MIVDVMDYSLRHKHTHNSQCLFFLGPLLGIIYVMSSNVHLSVLTHIMSLPMSVCLCVCAREQTKSQNTPEDKKEEAADAREEEQASQEENNECVNCTATARTHNHYQVR